MIQRLSILLPFTLIFTNANAQWEAAYLQSNAIRIENPEMLSDSVYALLSPFQLIMFGEIHGTNEGAPFILGLTSLLTGHGDSVQVGFEIPSELMIQFNSQRTDSSIYQSTFFHHPPYLTGKESFAWANLLVKLNHNPKVILFFFDVKANEDRPFQRDSLIYANIKVQFLKHPSWKMITLSGNYHNSDDGSSAFSWLRQDKTLHLSSRICSLNLEYEEGTCMASFGEGLEERPVGHPHSVYDDLFKSYIVLLPLKSYYGYTGYYYQKYVTAAKMVSQK